MELEHLRTFVTVIEAGSFAAAAERIHRSQSRVSAHVHALETFLDASLFDRSRHPAELTPVGRTFLADARIILRQVDTAHHNIRGMVGLTSGEVTLGSYPSASAYVIPQLLTQFTTNYPGVRVSVLERGTVDLDAAIEQEVVDLAIRPSLPTPQHPFESRELWAEPIRVVLPSDHPLAATPEPIALDDLRDEPLIVAGQTFGNQKSSEMHELLAHAGGEFRIALGTIIPQTVVAMVRNGLGIGLANQLALELTDLSGLAVRPVDDPDAVRVVQVYWRRNRPLSPAAQAMLEAIVTLCTDITLPADDDGTIAPG